MKKRVLVFLVAAALCVCAVASAYTNSYDLYAVKDFKFHHYKSGIGCGGCPVYTAPSLNAYRVGNATCGTNGDLYIAGVTSGWLLVRYETNNGGVRVGYIPPSYTQGFKFTDLNYMENINYSYIPCVAQDNIAITDNPMSNYSSFGTIYRGQQYYIMATYTYYGNWWYVETEIEGRPARGFISRDRTQVVTGYANSYSNNSYSDNSYSGNNNYSDNSYSGGTGYANNGGDSRNPARSPLGTPCLGTLTITMDPTIVRMNADPSTEMVGRVHSYETYPYYEYKTGSTGSVWYYIYIYGQNAWGWVSGQRVRVQ